MFETRLSSWREGEGEGESDKRDEPEGMGRIERQSGSDLVTLSAEVGKRGGEHFGKCNSSTK